MKFLKIPSNPNPVLTGKIFKLKSAVLGIETVNGKRTAFMIPEGASILVTSGPKPDDKRMVDIEWEERHFVIFHVDLQERGQFVRSVSGEAKAQEV